jgi:hypothetical protein
MCLALALLLAACGGVGEGGDGSGAAGRVARSDLGPVYASADDLLTALDAAGLSCDPATLSEDRAWDEHTGSCELSGDGTIYWMLDIGRATSPASPPDPGELGSGEERPEEHAEVCEHFGGAIVLGGNWSIVGDGDADLASLADGLRGYLFVADCDGDVEEICARDQFTGTRVFVTVSPDHMAVEPSEVAAGPAVICYGVSKPGRAYVERLRAGESVDLASLAASGAVSGKDLSGIRGLHLVGAMAATLDPGSHSEEIGSLVPGYEVFWGGMLPPDSGADVLPRDVPAPVAVLTVVDR